MNTKIRIVTTGMFSDATYIKSKLQKEIIPECIERYGCDDIEFVINSYGSGVPLVVREFVKENPNYTLMEFKLQWGNNKSAIATTNEDMFNYAKEEYPCVVIFGIKNDNALAYDCEMMLKENKDSLIFKRYAVR